MDSKSKYLAFAMMRAIMSYANQSPEPKPKKFKPKEDPKKVIPKGCKEYHFTNTGNQVTESCSYIYFSCVASSEKKAKLKFEKYLLLTNS